MKYKVKNNISLKILVPTVLVIITVALIAGWNISSNVEDQIKNTADQEADSELEQVSHSLESTNEVMSIQVNSAMNILKEKGLQIGRPELGGPVELKNRTVNDLLLGGKSQRNNFRLVDEMKNLTGASATLFVKNGADFVRLTTNIKNAQGERAIGTILDPAGKAFAKIKQGEPFSGACDILGVPYLTSYEPMYNSSHEVIGIWFLGYPATTLRIFGEKIQKTRIIDNGFLALLDDRGKTLFISNHTDQKQLGSILKQMDQKQEMGQKQVDSNTNEARIIEGWQVKTEKFKAWDYTIIAAYPVSDIEKQVNKARLNVFLLCSLLGLVLSVVIYIILKILIIRPVKLLSDASIKVASGDYNVSVNLKDEDELGMLATSFNKMVHNIKNSMAEIKHRQEEAEEAVREANRANAEIRAHEEYLQKNTARILSVMEKFSAGDLTVSLDAEKDDDIGKLISGINLAVSRIRKMVEKVRQSVESAAGAGTEISSSTEQMAAGAHQQAQQVTEIAGAVEEMAKTILENTRNAALSSGRAKEAGSKALEGGKVVKDTIHGINKIADVVTRSASTIEELGKSSTQIGEIIVVIDDIADQTNLLALNAAIEAARAGEQGRGFAVVADEVRKLAEKTTRATSEISLMVREIQKNTDGAIDAIKKGKEEVETGKVLAYKAGNVLEEIIRHTGEVTDIIDQVAAASEQQSSASEQISKSIEAISSVTQQSAAGIQQVANATDDLSKLTVDLQDLVSVFKIEDKLLFQ